MQFHHNHFVKLTKSPASALPTGESTVLEVRMDASTSQEKEAVLGND